MHWHITIREQCTSDMTMNSLKKAKAEVVVAGAIIAGNYPCAAISGCVVVIAMPAILHQFQDIVAHMSHTAPRDWLSSGRPDAFVKPNYPNTMHNRTPLLLRDLLLYTHVEC
jgi:hypothetical protein